MVRGLQESIFKKVYFIQQVSMIKRVEDRGDVIDTYILLTKKKKELELKVVCKLKI